MEMGNSSEEEDDVAESTFFIQKSRVPPVACEFSARVALMKDVALSAFPFKKSAYPFFCVRVRRRAVSYSYRFYALSSFLARLTSPTTNRIRNRFINTIVHI